MNDLINKRKKFIYLIFISIWIIALIALFIVQMKGLRFPVFARRGVEIILILQFIFCLMDFVTTLLNRLKKRM